MLPTDAAGAVDLHTHSSVSDGTDTPAGVVSAAAANGVAVLSLTDHDVIAVAEVAPEAWGGATEVARALGITLVPGCEISCHWWQEGRRRSAHLLGYLASPDAVELRERLVEVRDSRGGRIAEMADRIAADHPGLSARLAEVVAATGGRSVVPGRPHLARALVEGGAVGSMAEAFGDRWLGPGGPYYVRKASLPVEEAVGLLRRAGGVTVLAHPARRGYEVPDALVAALADAGLDGLEVDHPWQDEAARAALRRLAGDCGLLVTGGSDYHGANKAEPVGACLTDPVVYGEIVARAAARGGLRPLVPGLA